jgi:holliday junction DNA helicase RuvB
MFRPQNFTDIIGQTNALQRLQISTKAALARDGPLPHCIINGPPGVGKTSIIYALKEELKTDLQIANGGNLRTIKNVVPYIARIIHRSLLFIDEIHRCTPLVEEFLYPVLEDFRCDVGGESEISFDVPPFTMLGATTDYGQLSKPLRDRFPIQLTLELYNVDELTQIIQNGARKLSLSLTDGAARLISKTSRGTPRTALARLQWLRDFSSAKGLSSITEDVVRKALIMEEVEENGLTKLDKQYLQILREAKGPLGIQNLVAITGINRETIENVIEPFLLRLGFIQKTPKGRIVL